MTPMSRRGLVFALPALQLATAPIGSAVAQSHAAPAAAPPVARFSVGRFTITALTDGYVDMPYTYFPGRTPQQVEAGATAQFTARPSGVRFLFNCYLVDDGNRLVLVDTGPAGAFGQSGLLPAALQAIGVGPERIDAAIVTHLHADHIGGLVAGGRRNFPRAELYLDRRDLAYWTDPARRASAPDFLQSSFDASAQVARLYPGLQAIDGEREIARGISIVDLTGHTPGHIGVRIADGGQSLLMVSDMVFPVVHPAFAEARFLFEQDAAAAQAMRERFFPRAAEEGALIAATHMPFPGLGRIVRDGGRLCWLAADWALQG